MMKNAILKILLSFATSVSANDACHICKCLADYGSTLFGEASYAIEPEIFADSSASNCAIVALPEEKRSQSPFVWLGNVIRKRMKEAGEESARACHAQWRSLLDALRHGKSTACEMPNASGTNVSDAFSRTLVARCNEDQVVTTSIFPDPEDFAAEGADMCSDWPQPLVAQFLVFGRTDNVHFLEASGFPGNWEGLIAENPELDRVLWLLVQHADNTPAFQATALDRYTSIVRAGRGDPETWARLSDRVSINREKKQRFGTHWRCVDSKAIPSPEIIDSANVDDERAKFGLGPLADFLSEVTEQQCLSSP